MNKINIYHAIASLLNKGKLPDGINIITGFDPKLLVQLKGTYNHNYYKYDSIAILLEIGDDDNILEYFVCDKDFNVIGSLGYRYDDYSFEICNLEVQF